MSADSLPAELYQVICAFNADLLSQSAGGRTLLVQRLSELVRHNVLEAGPGSRLPVVVDSHGREVDRNALVAREQTVRACLAAVAAGFCCCLLHGAAAAAALLHGASLALLKWLQQQRHPGLGHACPLTPPLPPMRACRCCVSASSTPAASASACPQLTWLTWQTCCTAWA